MLFNHLAEHKEQKRKEIIASAEVERVKQIGTNNCLPASGESVNKSLGGNFTQSDFRGKIGGDPDLDPLPVGKFWSTYEAMTGQSVKGYNSSSVTGQIVSALESGNMVSLGLVGGADGVGHSVVLQSITAEYKGDYLSVKIYI